MYLMGNPIVLWAVLLGVIGFALIRVVALAQRGSAVINFAGVAVQASAISRFLSLGTYCFVCYWLNLLPVWRCVCDCALPPMHMSCYSRVVCSTLPCLAPRSATITCPACSTVKCC